MENKTLYRIQTELKNESKIVEFISRFFNGFTLLRGTGYWKLEQENSLTIEILGQDSDGHLVDTIAQNIKEYNEQEAVLVSASEVISKFI